MYITFRMQVRFLDSFAQCTY